MSELRRECRKIRVGKVEIGGGAPISVQSMTNTDTRDAQATLAQIERLYKAGADIVTVHAETCRETLKDTLALIRAAGAKCGAVIGLILAVSSVLENSVFFTSGTGFLYLMLLEFFAVAAVHYYLLHRYTRRRSQLYTADEGFSFGQGYGFLLAVSGFAGIIVGVVQAVYLHLIVGYANYIDHLRFVDDGALLADGRRLLVDGGDAFSDRQRVAELAGAFDAENGLGRRVELSALRRCFRPHHCGCDRTCSETLRQGLQRVVASYG